MYFLKRKVASVKQYAFLSNHLYHINEQEMLFCDGQFLFPAYGLEPSLNSIFCYSNLENVQTTVLSAKGVQKRIKEGLLSKSYNGQDTLSFRDYQTTDYTHQIGLYHVDSASMKWFPNRYSIGLNMRQNDTIWHLSFPNAIKCLSLTTGLYEWQTLLSTGRTLKMVGIYSDKLVVTYETAQNQTGSAALDLHTGAILWQQLIPALDPYYAAGTQRNTFVSLKNGGFWQDGVQTVKGSNLFIEIELQTGTFLRSGVLQELDDADLQVRTFEVKDRFIYFTANHQGSFGAIAVGVLSIQTLKLLWWEVVEMEQAGGFGNFLLNSITVAGNQFGILDKTGVLHLYEKKTGFRAPRTRQKGLVPFEALTVEPIPPFPIADALQQDPVESIPFRSVTETHVNDDLSF